MFKGDNLSVYGGAVLSIAVTFQTWLFCEKLNCTILGSLVFISNFGWVFFSG